jgi:oxaloacetate decarboxylase beta subunit
MILNDLTVFTFPAENALMIGIALILLYFAIVKKYEPLLLLPIGFGALMVNIPSISLMQEGGLFYTIYQLGIANGLFPCLIFIGIGAMCDFAALIERPWLLIFAAAGQIGIFIALLSALRLGFTPFEASSIGIIGAMDGPTAIYVSVKYANHLLGPITTSAYSYMSLVPLIQVPLCKALTTKSERLIRMDYEPKTYSRSIKIVFPIIVFLVVSIIVPMATPLIGCLMLGNLMKESGVVERLSRTAEQELTNIVTLLLGLTIGGTLSAENFLNIQTLIIFVLGLLAFVSGIAGGILLAKFVNFITHGKLNPLIGSCGISAFPMAARTAHIIGREEDPDNWLLMHALATNTGGQIASIIAGGVILTLVPLLLG